MKRDLKPFVVEVKRGTRRSSFLGQMDQSSTMSEAQRRAEAALFAPVMEESLAKAEPEPSRRILRSLVEPEPAPPPAIEDDAMPISERRPRPVGRPRKPRPIPPAVRAEEIAAAPLSPPKVPLAKVTMVEEAKVVSVAPPAAAAPAPRAVEGAVPSSGGRQRLRDRSSILARYVLGTEPVPGERWNRTARRMERRSRIVSE